MTIITNAPGKIWLALKSKIDTWSETPVMLPEGLITQYGADDAFIIAQPVGLEYENLTISMDCGDENRGILNLSVMVPTKWEYSAHVGLAGRLADHFMIGSQLTYQDATVILYQRSRVLGAPRLDQAWNRLEVQAYYRMWG